MSTDLAPPTTTQHESLWLATTGPAAMHPPLRADTHADVCVIGAGMVGTTLAWLLRQDGLAVVLIEADRIGAGVTGATTAKVTALHGMIYDELTRAHGADAAQRYARAQQDALRWMGDTVRDLGLECDWRTRTAATYTTEEDRSASSRTNCLRRRMRASRCARRPCSTCRSRCVAP